MTNHPQSATLKVVPVTKQGIGMVIEYHEAAFAHQIEEADIEWAIRTQFFERPAADGSYLAIGFNRVGNPL